MAKKNNRLNNEEAAEFDKEFQAFADVQKKKDVNNVKRRFVFIDDHPQNREQWLQWGKRNKHDAYAVESIFQAKDIPADFYVFDVSACGGGTIRIESAYSPICTMAELYPGAVFVIISGIAKSDVECVIDDVKEYFPDINIVYGGWGTYEDLEKAIAPFVV